MTLFETIFIRRSVRKFDMTPLGDEIIGAIEKFIADTRQLEGQKAEFEILGPEAANGVFAPHCILSYCRADDAAFINVGYVMQRADLFIQSLGLGSLWLGMARPKNGRPDFCILMAFGKTDVPRRNNVHDFNRLPIDAISNAVNTATEAARLAPSAMNSQPWKLLFEDGSVRIRYFGRGIMKLMLKKLNKIDVGIVTRHVEVALRHEGKEIKSITPRVGGKDLSVEIVYGNP
jgi:hypothetical protein